MAALILPHAPGYKTDVVVDAENSAQEFDLAKERIANALQCLSPSATLTTPRKEMVEGVEGAFIVRDLLSPSECSALLPLVRSLVSSDSRKDLQSTLSKVSLFGESKHGLRRRRPSQHHSAFSAPLPAMASLCTRLRPFLPNNPSPLSPSLLAAPGLEVSAHLRCYDYLPGDFSTPHYDRSAVDSRGGKRLTTFTAYSILLYLNDDFEGGRTTFFAMPPPSSSEPASSSSSSSSTLPTPPPRTKNGLPPGVSAASLSPSLTHVTPVAGSALVFPHGRQPHCFPDPLHEGEVVTKGNKTIIRTDAVFCFVRSSREGERKFKKERRKIILDSLGVGEGDGKRGGGKRGESETTCARDSGDEEEDGDVRSDDDEENVVDGAA